MILYMVINVQKDCYVLINGYCGFGDCCNFVIDLKVVDIWKTCKDGVYFVFDVWQCQEFVVDEIEYFNIGFGYGFQYWIISVQVFCDFNSDVM